jgi:23S rRNA pseudouridine1911/1915/1917 synthase
LQPIRIIISMVAIKQGDLGEYNEEDLYLHQEIICDKNQALLRIDKFLFDKLEGVSRSRVQSAITHGLITVNDKNVKSNHKIKGNDVIKLVLPRNPDQLETVTPEDIPLDIVYEDEHVIVINKQAGLVVHPGSGNPSGTLVNAILFHLQNSNLPVMKGNNLQRPGLVHRIDKDTSGLMVLAKTEEAMTHLAKQFFDHTIDREYQAIVWGETKDDKGTVTGDIGRHPRDRMLMTVTAEGEGGKHAVTHYEVLERLYYVSHLKCKLETGRTHQIRVHMKHIGNTLFNDTRYGGEKVLKGTIFTRYKQFVDNCFKILPRQALHACTLGFIHPITGEKMFFEQPLPEDFSSVLDKWRDYKNTRKEVLIYEHEQELNDEEEYDGKDK